MPHLEFGSSVAFFLLNYDYQHFINLKNCRICVKTNAAKTKINTRKNYSKSNAFATSA